MRQLYAASTTSAHTDVEPGMIAAVGYLNRKIHKFYTRYASHLAAVPSPQNFLLELCRISLPPLARDVLAACVLGYWRRQNFGKFMSVRSKYFSHFLFMYIYGHGQGRWCFSVDLR